MFAYGQIVMTTLRFLIEEALNETNTEAEMTVRYALYSAGFKPPGNTFCMSSVR